MFNTAGLRGAQFSKMSISFPKTEDEVLRFWREIDAFQTQLSLTEGKPDFTFYDGPPFGMFLTIFRSLSLLGRFANCVPF